MLQNMNSNFKVKLKKSELLDKLKENRENHVKMVSESQQGYLKEAESFLKKKLRAIRSGEVVPIDFSLKVPVDYTSEYDSVIEMFKMHLVEDVELSTTDFNQLVKDQWQWSHNFFTTNARYSNTVANVGAMRNL